METIINCLSKVSPGCLAATLRTLLSFLSFPDLGQLFLLCAWHVITTLICVVSLSPPYFFLSLCSSVIFSNSLETQGAGKSLTNSPLPPPPSCHMCNLSKVLCLFILMFVSPLITPLCLCRRCFNLTHCM